MHLPPTHHFLPAKATSVLEKFNQYAIVTLSVILCLFVLVAVNFNVVEAQSALAIFVGLGLMLCFMVYPLHPKLKGVQALKIVDWLLAIASAVCCGYVVWQTEKIFESMWFEGQTLAARAGIETTSDFWIGLVGLILVLEATRRSIGWIVPVLAMLFIAHSYYNYASDTYGYAQMPSALLPHGGQDMKDIVSTTFLQTLGVFGPAANVMFKYVFLFVVFGSFLEMSGATQFIIDFAQKVFGRSQGGPAQVSVLGSGLMGSLSGSAVANAVTTGSFTIPMMRNAGFPSHIAGGITAAAASGGALVPPVMGAAAYMMLEIVKPQPTFLEIVRSALIPALLYYFSLMAIVHFYSGLLGTTKVDEAALEKKNIWRFESIVFFTALIVLVGLLVPPFSFTPYKAVSGSLLVILVLTALRPSLNMATGPRAFALGAMLMVSALFWYFMTDPMTEASTWKTVFTKVLDSAFVGMFGLLVFGLIHPAWRPEVLKAFTKSAKAGISLVAASACVGIIIGIVQQTGIATDFSGRIKDVVETNLFVALLGIMACSLILGMGVPSVVCYLLMATLMGSLLEDMGVEALAAHLFIFYFGMMSMVTPPVALAGYASASIADSPIMKTSLAAFRFSLVGFTLPFMFIYQPNLLLMDTEKHPLTELSLTMAVGTACFGIVALAAGIVGFFDLKALLAPFRLLRLLRIPIGGMLDWLDSYLKQSPLTWFARISLFLSAAMLLSPDFNIGEVNYGVAVNIIGLSILLIVALGVNFLPPLKRRVRLSEDASPDAASRASGEST